MVIAVTGASGQVGTALQHIAADYPQIEFRFASSSEADITDPSSLERFFSRVKPQYCINAAAYTAVDRAEAEPEKAFQINVRGAANVALACKKYNATLIHLSTDFVFDGTKAAPYNEGDEPCPKSVYGETKLKGEREVQKILQQYFVIRTSWVYSQFGHNFMKTMLRLAGERSSLNVVDDQVGTPTYAVDLAHALVHVALSGAAAYGIYNYSNEGQCSWYDFAAAIFGANGINVDLNPIPTNAYPTPAHRPAYSVLDKQKIKEVFHMGIRGWEEALHAIR